MSKILVVDDRPINRKLLREFLKENYEILEATDGAEALALVRAEHPDLVITDVLMPTMDGYELVRQLRADPAVAGIPVIFYTAHYMEQKALRLAQACGATQVLLKPCEPAEILQAVGALLNKQSEAAVELLAPMEFRSQHQQLLTDKLAQQIVRLRALGELNLELVAERDPAAMLEKVCHAVREIVGARAAAIGVLAEGGRQLDRWLASGIAPETMSPLDFTLFSQRAAQRKGTQATWRIRSLTQEPWATFLPTELNHPFMAAQLGSPTQVYGWLLLLGKTDEPEFSEEEDRLASMIASQASYIYENRLMDAEARRRAEELEREVAERERAENGLRSANERLVEADRRKDEFLAMLAHELRNPLAPIRNAVAFLSQSGPAEPRLQRHRDIIERQVGHMSRLLDDLLDVSRITRGKIELRREKVDLRAVAELAFDSFRSTMEQHELHFKYEAPQAPLPVDGDATRLEQVLRNLLHNAVKYTEPGGCIKLSIGLKCRGGQDWQAVVHVRDSGIGLTPDLLEQIFEPFVQAEQGLARTQGGLGIGLTMVKRLVELHGGEVEARSDGPGQGCEFVVYLPLADIYLSELQGAGTLAQPAVDSRVEANQRRVLIVDDNVDAVSSLSDLLEMWGYQVQAAHDGRQALETARAWRPEVILLDIGLPGMDGFEVARRLRAEAEFASTVLVALTGYGSVEDQALARRAGFQAHYTKPVDLAALHQMLSGL